MLLLHKMTFQEHLNIQLQKGFNIVKPLPVQFTSNASIILNFTGI